MNRLNIVLVEPQIPQNTGNISRTCAVTGAALHLVKPYGFEISDKKLKRAGLDYWDKLEIYEYDNIDDFFLRTAASSISLPQRAEWYTQMWIIRRIGKCIYFRQGGQGSARETAL